jgi:cytolysin-activating lysine-acyltransferase
VDASARPPPFLALSEPDIEWLVMGPHLFSVGELEALGLVSWLWQHSPMNRNRSVGSMGRLVESAFEHRQFALAKHKNGMPLFYTSWARLDEGSERKLIADSKSLSPSDWASGEHIWMMDWIAPRGGTSFFHKALRSELFPSKVCWALRVRQDRRTVAIKQFRGQGVPRSERAMQWRRLQGNLSRLAHPSLAQSAVRA